MTRRSTAAALVLAGALGLSACSDGDSVSGLADPVLPTSSSSADAGATLPSTASSPSVEASASSAPDGDPAPATTEPAASAAAATTSSAAPAPKPAATTGAPEPAATSSPAPAPKPAASKSPAPAPASPKPSPASSPAGQTVVELRGLLGTADDPDAYEIGLTDTAGRPVATLRAGTYRIRVSDRSTIHNFNLQGPGVSEATSVSGVEEAVFTVEFTPGTYTYVCDPHQSMRGDVTVTA